MKKKTIRLKTIIAILFIFTLAIELFSPTWTPTIKGNNSISGLYVSDGSMTVSNAAIWIEN